MLGGVWSYASLVALSLLVRGGSSWEAARAESARCRFYFPAAGALRALLALTLEVRLRRLLGGAVLVVRSSMGRLCSESRTTRRVAASAGASDVCGGFGPPSWLPIRSTELDPPPHSRSGAKQARPSYERDQPPECPSPASQPQRVPTTGAEQSERDLVRKRPASGTPELPAVASEGAHSRSGAKRARPPTEDVRCP